MGMAKSLLDNNEWLDSLALSVLVKANVLAYCEAHGLYYDTEVEIERAFQHADKLLKRGGISLEGRDLSELHDALRYQLEEHVSLDGCVECERNRAS